MGIVDSAIVRLLPAVPKPVVRRISSRYIAGEELDDALRVVLQLNGEGKLATIDVLGEEITEPEEAQAIALAYREAFEAIERGKLDSNVSIKPTALGLKLGYDLFRENVTEVVEHAASRGNFVRIDMEDSSTTDDTLQLYRDLCEDGHENVGVVLQAYLRRTIVDLEGLANVRLCKGIYIEPPELAYREYEAVRANFVRCLVQLLEQGSYVGIATHDEYLVGEALRLVHERDLPRSAYELQMLLGVREDRADQLVREGHRLRVYVPYGTHWYEYSLRRLQENPALAGMIAKETVLRAVPGRG